jgi:hypothetical protein
MPFHTCIVLYAVIVCAYQVYDFGSDTELSRTDKATTGMATWYNPHSRSLLPQHVRSQFSGLDCTAARAHHGPHKPHGQISSLDDVMDLWRPARLSCHNRPTQRYSLFTASAAFTTICHTPQRTADSWRMAGLLIKTVFTVVLLPNHSGGGRRDIWTTANEGPTSACFQLHRTPNAGDFFPVIAHSKLTELPVRRLHPTSISTPLSLT